MEVDDVDMAVTAPLLQKQDLDDMKRRLKEMEEEDAALREMKEMSTTASAFSDVTKEPSVVFEKAKCYGVLGLGFREVYVGDDIPVWENMRTQGQVWSPLFSFWLSRDANEKEGGEIIFGRVNSNHYEGYHTFVPITQKGSWQFDLDDVLINGKSTVSGPNQPVPKVLDFRTGTVHDVDPRVSNIVDDLQVLGQLGTY